MYPVIEWTVGERGVGKIGICRCLPLDVITDRNSLSEQRYNGNVVLILHVTTEFAGNKPLDSGVDSCIDHFLPFIKRILSNEVNHGILSFERFDE